MKIEVCKNGHYYDKEHHDKCPICVQMGKMTQGIPSRFAELGEVTQIDRGGNGRVYGISRPVFAVKVIECGTDLEKYRNAQHEMDIMRKLRNLPHIVQLRDSELVEEQGNKTLYLLEDYHTPFSEYLSKKPVTLSDALQIMTGICEALIECKKVGVAHLDVQPKNIYVDTPDSVRIGDFGTALELDQLETDDRLRGTVSFMAPEVWREHRCSEQSDVYSVGMILYGLFNGRMLPFMNTDGKDVADERRMAGEAFPEIAWNGNENIKNLIWQLIQAACVYRAADRIRTFEELKEYLSIISLAAQSTGAGEMVLDMPSDMSEKTGETEDIWEPGDDLDAEENQDTGDDWDAGDDWHAGENCDTGDDLGVEENRDAVDDWDAGDDWYAGDDLRTEDNRDTGKKERSKSFFDADSVATSIPLCGRPAGMGSRPEEPLFLSLKPQRSTPEKAQSSMSEKAYSRAPESSPGQREQREEEKREQEKLLKEEKQKGEIQKEEKRRQEEERQRQVEEERTARDERYGGSAVGVSLIGGVAGMGGIGAEAARWMIGKMAAGGTAENRRVCEEQSQPVRESTEFQLSRVQFSAVAPKTFLKGDYTIIDIVMYEEAFRHVVDELIQEADSPMQEKKSGVVHVREGAQIRVCLTSPDIEIEDNEETREWQGGYQDFSFAVLLPEQYKKRQILFKASVYVNDVIATRLVFTAKCSTWFQQKIQITREDVLSAFVSYASEDRSRVAAIVQGMKKARPDMDIFLDVEKLRSGQDWEQALHREIEERDILYLCWSRYASKSKWVDMEWRYALEYKGEDSIEPIPIDPPAECPPPEELKNKHFNDMLLYLIKNGE